MKIIDTKKDLLRVRAQLKDMSIGIVPTMGNLHKGHLSLVQNSLQANNHTFVSIFVNPKQFGENEDLVNYPRTFQEDIQKLKQLDNEDGNENSIIVFAPKNEEEIFPISHQTSIEVNGMTDKLCGKSRPGHFRGVTTVVYQLFMLVKPTNAYFGKKDYQQYLVIKQMTEDLLMQINIHALPIIREESGLALSSRNQFLNSEQKKKSLTLFKTLSKLKRDFLQNKELPQIEISNIKKSSDWDYLEVLDANTLNEVDDKTNKYILAGAYKIGNTRLIDNIVFQANKNND
jgi:pantoate--beta-alanine ligase